MSKTKLHNLLATFIAALCLIALPLQAQAKPAKAAKVHKPQSNKEHLVLMPLRVSEDDKSLQGSMEAALAQGLRQKYDVYSGEQVAQRAKEIFNKESHNAKHDCNETRCMQDIASSFNAELIATASVAKRADGYFLALSIQNIFDNKLVDSFSTPCQNCNAYQVIDKLRELSGAPAPVVAVEEPQIKINPADTESVQWGEVQKGNSIEDYEAYLSQYSKGKYAILAKSKIKKLKEQEAAAQTQQDQSAWESANSTATEASYQGYLSSYPQGSYANLATARITKLKKEAALAAAQGPKVGAIIRDCADCPEMVIVPAGSFNMGEANAAHRVTIGKPFAMGKTEVTQGQWKAIMGSNPSNFKSCGDNCPVEQVNWNEAKEFIQKLNAKTGKQYRLPSEAEWEYACRAGGQNEYCGGDNIDSVAWYGAYANPVGNSAKTTNPVATKQANAWGLYDMSGNVWEWVEDSWYDNYSGAPTDGTAWQGDGAKRVLRGGSWYGRPQCARAAYRFRYEPAFRGISYGFRLARMLP